MANDTRTLEIPADSVAIDATATPLGLTAHLAGTMPEPLEQRFYAALDQFNMKMMARFAALSLVGPAVKAENSVGCLKIAFLEAMKTADNSIPDTSKKMTPAMRLFAEDIAELIDKATKNLMITADNEEYVNHDAFLDIVEGHSLICAGLLGLNQVPADYSPDEEKAN